MLCNRYYKIIKIFTGSIYLLLYLANALNTDATEAVEQNLYELRGIFEIGGEYNFSLFYEPTQKAAWGKIGRTVFDAQLLYYDPESKELTIACRETVSVLKLKKAGEAPLAIDSQSSENPEEYTITPDDIDPEKAGNQSYHQIRKKLKFAITPRVSKPTNDNVSENFDSQISSEYLSTKNLPPSVESPLGNFITDSELNEYEAIALSLYEKNYVSSREPPPDIEVRFSVSPR